MSEPFFSVITPSYQQGKFIEDTIESVLNQKDISLDEIDYIVCDAQSTDQTLDVLNKYKDRLRWTSEPDAGQADAVNKGIRMTEGDIIAWINSDDIYYPNTFAIVQKVFLENLDVNVVYGNANWIDESGGFLIQYPVEKWDYKRLWKNNYICQPSVFFRRSIIDDLGLLNTELHYCMDYELWLRYGEKNPFCYIQSILSGSRIYSSNKSVGSRLNAHQEVNDMLLKKIDYIPTTWIISYSLVKSEEENSLDRSEKKDLYKLIIFMIFNSLNMAIQHNLKGLPEILLKSIFWLLFPKQKANVDPWLKAI
ncbi:MAG: glycosyltransferase family 2 protein [Leptolyngbyaceae cyanobacterium]